MCKHLHIMHGDRLYTSRNNPRKIKQIKHDELPQEPFTITFEDGESGITTIGANAFKDCEYLTSVTIPNSVTKIERNAFRGCNRLKQVIIPDSVSIIGAKAFYCCVELEDIRIPNMLDEIGYAAFSGCRQLPRDIIKNNILISSRTSFGNVIIPDGVTEIGTSAFEECTCLTQITIPNTVRAIGANAFKGCTTLTLINNSDHVTEIRAKAFSGCKCLNTVTIPTSVRAIWNEAFKDCKSIQQVNINKRRLEEIACDAFELGLKISAKHTHQIGERTFRYQYIQNIADILQTNADPDDIVDIFYRLMWTTYDWSGSEVDNTLKFYDYSVWLNRALDRNDESSCKDCIRTILDWGGVGQQKDILVPQFFDAILAIRQGNNIDLNALLNLGCRRQQEPQIDEGQNGLDQNIPEPAEDDRISTWSKILAAYMPGKCFIYDSRVALTLSYISLKLNNAQNNIYSKCFWRIPEERKKTDNRDNNIENRLFVHFLPQQTVKVAVEDNRRRLERDGNNEWIKNGWNIQSCYGQYLSLLAYLACNPDIKRAYGLLPSCIRKAYQKVFAFIPDNERRESKAIMAHLEKMLFMQKEIITRKNPLTQDN